MFEEDDAIFQIKIPMLNDDFVLLSSLVDKKLKHRLEVEALEVMQQIEHHPTFIGLIEPANIMEQCVSFVLQNILTEFFYVQDRIQQDNPPT